VEGQDRVPSGPSRPDPYDRGKTEQAREGFMETQAAIEAMDRAIEDEEETRRAVYDRS
jgi:hypothetical protein